MICLCSLLQTHVNIELYLFVGPTWLVGWLVGGLVDTVLRQSPEASEDAMNNENGCAGSRVSS